MHYTQNDLAIPLKEYNKIDPEYLFDTFCAPLYSFIKRIVTDDKMAGKILQLSFLKIRKDIESYNQETERLFTWMINITRNIALEYLQTTPASHRSRWADHYDDPLSQPFQISEHLKYISQLNPEYRMIWELAIVRGYTTEEISGLLNIPADTVKNKVYKACKELTMLAG